MNVLLAFYCPVLDIYQCRISGVYESSYPIIRQNLHKHAFGIQKGWARRTSRPDNFLGMQRHDARVCDRLIVEMCVNKLAGGNLFIESSLGATTEILRSLIYAEDSVPVTPGLKSGNSFRDRGTPFYNVSSIAQIGSRESVDNNPRHACAP